MPIKSASIDFSNAEEEKTESELRKQALSQIYKDGSRIMLITYKVFLGFIFCYGLISLLQDVNLI